MAMFGPNLLLFALILVRRRRRRLQKSRRFGIHPILKLRKAQGFYNNLVAELRLYPEMHFDFLRMTPTLFDTLLNLMAPKLEKNCAREPISPAERLVITLRYLCSGESQRSLSFAFRVGRATTCKIIHETLQVIWETLMPIYLPAPTKEMWESIATNFYHKWNFPLCVGALDGKHVQIQSPKRTGSLYFNYKGTFSMVLLALCDADYCFTMVDIGGYGRQSDGGTLKTSAFGKLMDDNKLNLPTYGLLPGTNLTNSHCIVADEAFPLRKDMMRPYPGKQLDSEERRIYNYRLSRARRVIENCFGVISSRFRIFRGPIIADVNTVKLIIKASVCLHNFLIKSAKSGENPTNYCPPGWADSETDEGEVLRGDWRKITANDSCLSTSTKRFGSNMYANSAEEIRKTFVNYFNSSAGSVPWQLAAVRKGSEPTRHK